jgi:acetamidase/formamidase
MTARPLLQSGEGVGPGDRYLPARPATVRWGQLPTPHDAPATSLASGDVITIDTVSHEGFMEDQGNDPVAFFGRWGIGPDEVLGDVRELADAALDHPEGTGPHLVVGPVAVAGARVGDVLSVETLALDQRAPYGIISNRHGRGVLSGELPRATAEGHVDVVSVLARVEGDGRTGRIDDPSGRALRFPLAPFLGLVGVTPDEGEARSSRPPGPFGGNIDIRHLGVGSRLLLPVQVPEAGLYVGDPHFAQGNGEVALTAFEAPLRATLRVEVLADPASRELARLLANPWGESGPHLVVVGLGSTVDEALRQATRRSVDLVAHLAGVEESTALAFCSAAVDFEISQAVNGVVGVHALIRKHDLRA